VLTLARRNLEPDSWWLDQRPGRDGALDRGRDEEDAVGPAAGASAQASAGAAVAPPPARAPVGVAAVMRALRAAAPASGRDAYAKTVPAGRGGRAAAFGATEADGEDAGAGGAGAGAGAGAGGGGRGDEAEAGHPQDHEDERVLERAVRSAVSAGLPGAGQWARLVRAPLKRNAHVILDVCTPQGSFERRVASKGKLKEVPGAYRAARKSRWGALWPNWLARLKGDGAVAAAAALPLLEHHAAAATLLEAPPPALPAGAEAGEGGGGGDEQQRPKRSSRKARRRRAMAAALDNFASEEDRAKAAHSMERGASVGNVRGAAVVGSALPSGARRVDASALLRRMK
jgi:hypothetical protein